MCIKYNTGNILLFLLWLLPAQVAGQQQEELSSSQRETYEQGMQLLRDGHVDDAIKSLEKVVRKDTQYGPVLNTLAEAYMARNSLQDRLKAERLLKRALEVDHTNVDYNLNLGKLRLLQGLPLSAREQFEKTLTLNQNAVRAHFELGRLHLEDMLQYDHMISLDDPLNIVHYYDRFANRQSETDAGARRDRLSRASDAVTAMDSVFQEESFKASLAARIAFEKVLAVMPEDRDVNYYLALLEFYHNDFQAMTRYARHVVMNTPNDRDGLLLLGLGLTRLQEYDPAWAMFARALSLMTPEERREFTSASQVMAETASQEDTDDEETKRFWASQDPLFMTRYNERELEHFSRVVEANLRFTVDANANSSGIKALPGWKTDRGRFFIKYGKPQQWYSLRSDIPGIDAVDAGGGRPYEKRGLELWQYKEFSIGFWDPYHSGKAVFADEGVFPGMDFREEAGVLSKEIPQIYYPDYEAKQFSVPYTITQFRGSGGLTDLHVTYGLPARKLRFIPDPQGYIALIKRGLFLFDEDWTTGLQNVEDVNVQTGAAFHVTRRDVFPSVQTLRVNPGVYTLALEVEEQYERNTGVARSKVEVYDFTGKGLRISDLLFANNIEAPQDAGIVKRSDFKITPNLEQAFPVYHPVYLYYEVYSLLLDPVTHRSRYRVECTVEVRERELPGIWKIFRDSRSRQEQKIVTAADYEGAYADEHQYLRVDIANSPPGLYEVTLRVRDLVAGSEITRKSHIRLVPLEPRTDGAPSLDPDILRDGLRSSRISPEDPVSHYHLGVVYYNAGSLEYSIREYREALRYAPDLAEAHYGLALALRDRGLVTASFEQARLAWKSDEENVRYRVLCGNLAALSGNYLEGLDMLASDQQEEIPELKFAYARLIQHPGSLQQAAEQFNLAAIDDKDFPEAHHAFGRALQQMGRPGDAAAWLERAKHLDPRFSPFYHHRRFPELIEDWEQTAVDSLAWFMDYHVSDLRPDSTTLVFWYILHAPQSDEQVESLIEARLTVFNADWNIVKHQSVQGTAQPTSGESWIDGGLYLTLKPGRYFLSMALMERHSRRFGSLVRELIVPAAGEEGLIIPAPALHRVNGNTGYPWYSTTDSLVVSFAGQHFDHTLLARLHITAVALLRQNRSVIKAMIGASTKEQVYFEQDVKVGALMDTSKGVQFALSGHETGTCLIIVEGLNASGVVIGRSVRRYTVGFPFNDTSSAPRTLPLGIPASE